MMFQFILPVLLAAVCITQDTVASVIRNTIDTSSPDTASNSKQDIVSSAMHGTVISDKQDAVTDATQSTVYPTTEYTTGTVTEEIENIIKKQETETTPLQDVLVITKQDALASVIPDTVAFDTQDKVSFDVQYSVTSTTQKTVSPTTQNTVTSVMQETVTSPIQDPVIPTTPNKVASTTQNPVFSPTPYTMMSSSYFTSNPTTISTTLNPVTLENRAALAPALGKRYSMKNNCKNFEEGLMALGVPSDALHFINKTTTVVQLNETDGHYTLRTEMWLDSEKGKSLEVSDDMQFSTDPNYQKDNRIRVFTQNGNTLTQNSWTRELRPMTIIRTFTEDLLTHITKVGNVTSTCYFKPVNSHNGNPL